MALDSFSFSVGVEPGLLGGSSGNLSSNAVTLIDDDHDSVLVCESARGSSTQHDGDGFTISVEQVQTGRDAERRDGHGGWYECGRRDVNRPTAARRTLLVEGLFLIELWRFAH